jgi:hypothetical protein
MIFFYYPISVKKIPIALTYYKPLFNVYYQSRHDKAIQYVLCIKQQPLSHSIAIQTSQSLYRHSILNIECTIITDERCDNSNEYRKDGFFLL